MSERFVKLVAETLRYGSWTKRIVTIAGVAFVALNPVTIGKGAEFFGVRELPKEYTTALCFGMGGLGVVAIGGAIVTLPKRTLEQHCDSETFESKLLLSQGLGVESQKFIKHS